MKTNKNNESANNVMNEQSNEQNANEQQQQNEQQQSNEQNANEQSEESATLSVSGAFLSPGGVKVSRTELRKKFFNAVRDNITSYNAIKKAIKEIGNKTPQYLCGVLGYSPDGETPNYANGKHLSDYDFPCLRVSKTDKDGKKVNHTYALRAHYYSEKQWEKANTDKDGKRINKVLDKETTFAVVTINAAHFIVLEFCKDGADRIKFYDNALNDVRVLRSKFGNHNVNSILNGHFKECLTITNTFPKDYTCNFAEFK